MPADKIRVVALGGCGGMGQFAVRTAVDFDFVEEIVVADRDQARAREFAERGYELGPDQYTTSVLAWILTYLRQREEAIHLYRSALEFDPDGSYIPAEYNLAYLFLLDKRYREALDLLAALEMSFQGHTNIMRSKILNNMGYALWWLGDREKAKARFLEALRVTPDFEDAQKNLDAIRRGDVPQTVNIGA